LFDGPAIPDSVVSRPDDNDSFSSSGGPYGLKIESDEEWPEIGGKISAETSNVTIAEVYDLSDDSVIGSADISDLSAGDEFTISLDEHIVPDKSYAITVNNPDDQTEFGRYDDPSFPYISDDDKLSITAGIDNDLNDRDEVYGIVEVGKVGFD